jgi:peptidoglycan hydrolase CwlO-like protein
VSKKLIIIAAAGLVSFVGAFAVAWFTNPTTAPPPASAEVTGQLAGEQTGISLPAPTAAADSEADAFTKQRKTITEKQLKDLVYQVREKMQEYNRKLQTLELREQRLQIAQDSLKNDIENLNKLRVELASIVAGIKSERDMLLNSRVKIAQAEKANLTKIAATYDRMDPEAAAKILTNMSQMQTGRADRNFDDAVKILNYMTERTKAKLIAAIAETEPTLAAVLCRKLKQVIEKD